MQPVRGAGFLQLLRQLGSFEQRQQRVPDEVGAGGEALHCVLDGVGYFRVIVFELVGWIDQHQTALGWRGQGGFQHLEAIRLFHHHTGRLIFEFAAQKSKIR